MMDAWKAAYRAWTGKGGVSALLFSYGDQAHILEELCHTEGLEQARLPMMASLGPFSTPHRAWWGKGLLWDADAVQAGRDTVGLLLDRMAGGPVTTKLLHWDARSLESYWHQGEKR
jgi:hypothetical protein